MPNLVLAQDSRIDCAERWVQANPRASKQFRLAAGCHPNRRTFDAIAAAGFDTTGLRSIRTPVPFPCKPHLQGFTTAIEGSA